MLAVLFCFVLSWLYRVILQRFFPDTGTIQGKQPWWSCVILTIIKQQESTTKHKPYKISYIQNAKSISYFISWWCTQITSTPCFVTNIFTGIAHFSNHYKTQGPTNRIWWQYRFTLVEWYKQLILPIDHQGLVSEGDQRTLQMYWKPRILGSKK